MGRRRSTLGSVWSLANGSPNRVELSNGQTLKTDPKTISRFDARREFPLTENH